MINWKELEKFIAPGKVVTLVIVVDGNEIGALSFNVDTLAYKEILEVIKEKPAVVIADKPVSSPKKQDTKKAEAPKPISKPEPEPMDDDLEEEEEEENEEDLDPKVDEVEKANAFIKKAEEKAVKDFNKQAATIITSESRPVVTSMTRDQIMAEEAEVKTPAPKQDLIGNKLVIEEDDDDDNTDNVNSHPDLFSDEW